MTPKLAKTRIPSPPDVSRDRREQLVAALAKLNGRRRLIVQLLNPVLTMQQACLMLDLSQTTVRRATESGTLKSFRTAGGQRRFRLLDILEYMDRREGGLLDIFVETEEEVARLAKALQELEEEF